MRIAHQPQVGRDADQRHRRGRLAVDARRRGIEPLLVDRRIFGKRALPAQQSLVRSPHAIAGANRFACGPTASTTPARSQPMMYGNRQRHRHHAAADVGVDRVDVDRLDLAPAPGRRRASGLGRSPIDDRFGRTRLLDVGGFHASCSLSGVRDLRSIAAVRPRWMHARPRPATCHAATRSAPHTPQRQRPMSATPQHHDVRCSSSRRCCRESAACRAPCCSSSIDLKDLARRDGRRPSARRPLPKARPSAARQLHGQIAAAAAGRERHQRSSTNTTRCRLFQTRRGASRRRQARPRGKARRSAQRGHFELQRRTRSAPIGRPARSRPLARRPHEQGSR